MKKRLNLVRSSALSLKFANAGKRGAIAEFLAEYARCVALFVERFWPLAQADNLAPMPNTALCKQESWLTVRALQCAAKQAAGICRGANAKNIRRLKMADALWERGERAKSKRLREIAHLAKVGVPEIGRVEAQLDARFFSLEISRGGKWELWLTLKGVDSRKRGSQALLPLQITRHWKRFAGAKLLPSLRLSESGAIFAFQSESAQNLGTKTLAVDIGLKATLSTSDGVQHRAGNHEHTLESVNARMCRRKRGSNGFRRAERHRDNLIRETVNRLNLHDVGTLRLERIKNMKRGKRVSRKLSHWSSRDIFAALESRAEKLGVQVSYVNPRWTSQRCSGCGWVQKCNRQGEQFGCRSCGNAANADLNAALNIAASLPALPETAVRERWNMRGFFWNPNAPVVRHAHESAAGRDIVREARKPRKVVPSRARKIFQ